uniref:Uncharacterized protein n=1 Tax=viral metagenome TaxID=1070528 RepID=A0A6M3M170_9ZZZZ
MRTEEEKVIQAPIKIVLGGKEYEVKPLVIKDSRGWRAELSKMLGMLPRYANVTTDTPDKFQAALDSMLISMPDKVVDLVFAYAPGLDREAIEAIATDAEMAKAFEQILEVAFPLAVSTVGAMAKLSR